MTVYENAIITAGYVSPDFINSRDQLTTQRRHLCNIRAEFDKDIAKMQAHRAAIDAGIQALEAQINQMIDKPKE